jgi:RNA-directed DNA polymerase
VRISEEKTRFVDVAKGESFGFLGFEFRRIRSLRGKWQPYYPPKPKQRIALPLKLKDIFGRFVSQPADRVVQLINPILCGWVNNFSIGDAGRCFSFEKDWVEKKVRRHLIRARNRRAFGDRGQLLV